MAGAKAPLTFRIFKGDQLIREERLSLSVIKLGKVPSAHLKLDDETVSRMHAIIEVNGPGDVSIIDLGSTKGTFVNGQKVNKAKLQSGDTIVVGETRIELAIGAAEDDEPTKVNTGAAPPALAEIISSTPRPPATPPARPPVLSPMPSAPAQQSGFAPPQASNAMASTPAPAVRPPPGMPGGAPIYGTAMAPPQGFQQSMAESVDDVSGARAVEVAAMLGDSVVNVKHCIDPRSGKVSPLTYGLFVFGAICLLSSAYAFMSSVNNAAKNKARYDYLTQKEKRPGSTIRPHELSGAYDFIAFAGLLLSIVSMTAGLARMRAEKRSPFYRIGTAPGVEFPTEGAPSESFPLVAPYGDDFSFNFAPGMEGEMIVGGQSTPLSELAAQGRTAITPIPPNAKIRVRAGKTTFLVSAVPQPRRYVSGLFATLESHVLGYIAASLAVHMGLWFLLLQQPPDNSNANIELGSREELSNRSNSTAQEDATQKEEEKPDDGEDESGGTGTAMALEEGKMGKKESDRKEGQYKMKKEQEDPQLARQAAVEQARNAGVLGSTQLTQGGAFASLTGTGDISSGFDDTNIYGGLLGNEAGEMQGGFGYGRSGFGPGGGGTGWGTIGTGRYGTIGHGSGTGSGYGVGGGRGGMRGRTASVPTVSIGQPTANGDLDKAIIRRYIKRNQSKIQYCYEKELLVKPSLAGTVMTNFLITPNGNVSQSSGTGVDSEVASCVANVIKNIEFPKPKGGGNVQVNYPFIFRLGGGS